MIKQQESIIQKKLMQLYDYCIIPQVKKLTSEYHLMSDEQLTGLLIKTRDEIQRNRINKLLRNINLFIICRSLFGYMGLYNVHNKIMLPNSLKKSSYAKTSCFYYLTNVERLYIESMSLIIAYVFRTSKYPYYTYSSLLKLLDSIERLNQPAHNNIVFPVLLVRNMLYNNKICILFDSYDNIHAFQSIDNFLSRIKYSYANSSNGDYYKLHAFIKLFINITTTKEHAITYNLFNTQNTEYDPVFDNMYLWPIDTISSMKNPWINTLRMGKAHLSDLGEAHELVLSINPIAYVNMLIKKYSGHKIYIQHKKLPLNIRPDGLMSSIEYARLYNLYKIYISEMRRIANTNNAITYVDLVNALGVLTNTIIEENKHKNNTPLNDIVYSTFMMCNDVYQKKQRDATVSNEIVVFNNRLHIPNRNEKIGYIYYDKIHDKYISILHKIRKDLNKECICIAVESRVTLITICSLLHNHSIRYRLYDFKNTLISRNCVYIVSMSDIHIYRLYAPDSPIIVIEYTSDIHRVYNRIGNIVYYLSKEDPLLANRPIIKNNIKQGYYERPPLPQIEAILNSIDKNKATIYNSSSLRRLKYISVYKEYIVYTIHINNILTDIHNLKNEHYRLLMRSAATYIISMHLANGLGMKQKNTLFNKLVMNCSINNKLGKYIISTNHIEQKNKLKRSQIYKQKVLLEHIRIHDDSMTSMGTVNISDTKNLNNMAYIIKKTILHDVKDIYSKNTYNTFKKNKCKIEHYSDFLHKTLLASVIRILYDIYYYYNKM